MARKTSLIVALVFAILALIVIATTTVLWMSMGGTFRGEDASAGTRVQLGLAVASCLGLGFLIPLLLRAVRKA